MTFARFSMARIALVAAWLAACSAEDELGGSETEGCGSATSLDGLRVSLSAQGGVPWPAWSSSTWR